MIESHTDHGPFDVMFGDETKEGSNEYQALNVRTFRRIERGRPSRLQIV